MPTMNPSTPGAKLADALFFNVTRAFAWLTLLIMAGIVVSLTWSAWPSIKTFGFGFLASAEWNPPAERFGAWCQSTARWSPPSLRC